MRADNILLMQKSVDSLHRNKLFYYWENSFHFFRSKASAPEYDFGSAAVVLNEHNFERAISGGNIFVMFFSPC